jgi:HD superfamily phosphohydrolase
MAEKLSFYDPLYETINFEQEIVKIPSSEKIYMKKDPANVFKELLNSYEMSRLLFLRQAGVNFIEFPSATSNRFAHSLGCWFIGTYALERVTVKERRGTSEKLKDWLDKKDKIFEFLIALLVHDSGHGPFSHVLEQNKYIDFSDKQFSGELVTGEGRFAKLAEEKAGESKTIAAILDEYDLNKKFIRGLISLSDDEFEREFSEEFIPIKDLIDSKIDLDRLDHYCRDSKYMGIKLADFNIHAFLENIVLLPGDARPTRVKDDGIPHVLYLLYSKELIWMVALDKPSVRAYEAILNEAVSIAIENGEVGKDEIVFYTDDELLHCLRTSDDKDVRDLFLRLIGRKPYIHLQSTKVPVKVHRKEIEEKIEEIVSKSRIGEHDLLVTIPFKDRPKESSFWLQVATEEGVELSDKYQGFCTAVWEEERERNRTIKFFARDEEVMEKVEPLIKAVFK